MGATVYSRIEFNYYRNDSWEDFMNGSLYLGMHKWHDSPGIYAPEPQLFEENLLKMKFPKNPSKTVGESLINIFMDSNALRIADRLDAEVKYSDLISTYESKETPSIYVNNFKELIEADYDEKANLDAVRDYRCPSENSENLESEIKACLSRLAKFSDLTFPEKDISPIKEKYDVVDCLESKLGVVFENNLSNFLELANDGSTQMNGFKVEHKPLKRRELVPQKWLELLDLIETIIDDLNQPKNKYKLEDFRLIVYVTY